MYQLTSPSGKSYVGITSRNALERFAKHVEHALGKRQNGVLYSALRKYGPDKFEVKTLVIANDFQYLCDLEIKAIAALGSRYPLGYNMTDGGEGVTGKKPDGFSDKVSVAQRKRFARPDERARAAVAGELGRAAHIKNCEARRINGMPPWKHRKHIERPRRGSPEHLAKLSASVKLAMATPEVQAKLRKPRGKI